MKPENDLKGKFGLHAMVTLYSCPKEKLENRELLKSYLKGICKVIGMQRVGQPIVSQYGKGHLSGLTAVQLIETSNIIIHNVPASRRVFLDIFSCKPFDPEAAARFSREFFQARSHKLDVVVRD